MNDGFVIQLQTGQFAAKSGDKYDGPITNDLILARFFKTEDGAERTLTKLKRDGAYGHKFKTATIKPITVSISKDMPL